MKNIPFILALSCFLACNLQQEKHCNNFDNFLEDYFQESLKLYRINGTYLGDQRYNDTLPNFLSPEFREKQRRLYAFYINHLFSFNDKNLTSDRSLSKTILIRELELELKGLNFNKDLMSIDQMWIFQLTLGQLASGKGAQPFVTPKDYRN